MSNFGVFALMIFALTENGKKVWKMRDIIFRGKRIDNGEWVEGYYIKAKHHWHKRGIHEDWILKGASQNGGWLAFGCRYAVIPETVGQYTGLKDKNGEMIFEGDIVKGTFYGYPMPFKNYVFEIGWQEDVAGYKANYFENVEVIGNIYDNSELIGGREDE